MRAPDDKLREPGAGHQNRQIDRALLKSSYASSEASEGSLEWLRSLRPQPAEPGPCLLGCGAETDRVVAAGPFAVTGRGACGTHGIRICPTCAERLDLAKLKRAVAKPELAEDLRGRFLRLIAELEGRGVTALDLAAEPHAGLK